MGEYQSHRLAFDPGEIDPASGVPIPFGENDNLRMRHALDQMVKGNPEREAYQRYLCAKSFRYWASMYAYTLEQTTFREGGQQVSLTGEGGNAPWIVWPVHEALHQKIMWCQTEGKPLIVPKSRETLATWHLMLEALWYAMFHRGASILIVSEKEDKIDARNLEALFPRMEYVLRRQPHYIRLNYRKTFKSIEFFDTAGNVFSSIFGDTTTENVGVGQRPTRIIFDEAARNPYLRQSWESTQDSTKMRIACSTPLGPVFFKDLCFDKRLPLFVLGYWDHPRKAFDRQVRVDETGLITRKPGSSYWWTSWFEREIATRTPRDIAQNLLIDHDLSGLTVFDTDVLQRLIGRAQATAPYRRYELRQLAGTGEFRDRAIRDKRWDTIELVAGERGRLKVWGDLERFGERWRLPQDRDYVIFADVSNGLSSSNSVAAIGDVQTRRKVAQYETPVDDPATFARILCELSLWAGGIHSHAWVGWEANGPGEIVSHHMRRLAFPRVFREPGADTTGWYSSGRGKKTALLEELRSAYARDEVEDFDVDTLQEAGSYVFQPSGEPIPAYLQEDKDAKATHGDRVIATAGMWMMMSRMGRPPTKGPQPPEHSHAMRILRQQAKEAESEHLVRYWDREPGEPAETDV